MTAKAWEVNTRQGNIYSAFDGSYIDHDDAMAVGVVWQLKREADADEMAFRQRWQEHQKL